MAQLPILVLLPPSEGKAEGGKAKSAWKPDSGSAGTQLAPLRRAVAGAYAKDSGVKVIGAPTLPAHERYTGVVWKHLDLGSIASAQRRQLVKRIFVVSGLLGLVRGDDPTPSYKLKMSARLAPLGPLAKFWSPIITSEVAKLSHKNIVVDLLPNEHRAAIDWSQISNHVRVDLVAKSGGRVGGHDAKAAKGLLARHILTGRSDIKSLVASFRHPVYKAVLAPPPAK